MDRKEHVHIISAGEKIHIAYPAMFRELPVISRTIVFLPTAPSMRTRRIR